MICPKCKADATRVIQTKTCRKWLRRRRICKNCGYRFSTHEVWDGNEDGDRNFWRNAK